MLSVLQAGAGGRTGFAGFMARGTKEMPVPPWQATSSLRRQRTGRIPPPVRLVA